MAHPLSGAENSSKDIGAESHSIHVQARASLGFLSTTTSIAGKRFIRTKVAVENFFKRLVSYILTHLGTRFSGVEDKSWQDVAIM
jgi:hypothetical protein